MLWNKMESLRRADITLNKKSFLFLKCSLYKQIKKLYIYTIYFPALIMGLFNWSRGAMYPAWSLLHGIKSLGKYISNRL